MIGSFSISCRDFLTSLILSHRDIPTEYKLMTWLPKVFPVFSHFSFSSHCLYSAYVLLIVSSKSQKLPVMVLCLGEPPRRFLWYELLFFISFSLYFSFLNFLHSHLLFCAIPHPSVDYRQGFTPILYFSAQLIAEWFAAPSFSTIPISSYHERYGFEWAFFTHRRFLPYAPSPIFWLNLCLSRPPWEPAVLPWSLQGFILILETQTRPICLFDSQ